MEKVSVAPARPARAVLLPALISMSLFAAGAVMSVFYFPAAATLVSLKSSVRKYDFPLLMALSALVVAATAHPAALALCAAAVYGCMAAGRPAGPQSYFRKLSAGFFSALTLLLAGGWILSLFDGAEIFRAISKIFLFSLAGNADMASAARPAELAEKAFRMVPAMAMIMLSAGYFLNLAFTGFFTGKRTSFGRAAKALPISVYLLALAIALAVAQEYFAAAYLSANLLTLSLFLFFVSGCGIIWSTLMRLGAGRFLAGVTTASFVFIWPAAAAVGVLGRWIKFKKKGRE